MKQFYQVSENVYSIQKRAELMNARYTILECFADLMQFSKKLLEKAGLPVKCKRISPHVLVARVHFKFSCKEAFKSD